MSKRDNIIQIPDHQVSVFAHQSDDWDNIAFDQRLVNVLAMPIERELRRQYDERMQAVKPAKWKV